MEPQEFLKILKDPILWADYYLKWKPRKFQIDILNSKSRKRVLRLPRRTGKTESMIIEALYSCFTRKNFATLVIAPYNSQIIRWFDTIDEYLLRSDDLMNSIARKTNSPWLRKFRNGAYVAGFTTGVKSKSKADTVRGARGDLILIDEADRCSQDDLDSVLAILSESIESRVVVASTPTGKREFFYRICNNKELNWEEFHYPPSYCLPHWSPELEAEQRANLSEDGYIKEWLAEWGEETEGVFRKEDLDIAHKKYPYVELNHNPKTIRTFGVDWDKYQAGPNICITEYDPEAKRFKVIYRIEMPRSKYRLDDAILKIIELNSKFEPAMIYVDRGFGEHQVETLHKHGDLNPETRLHKIVKGVSYSESIEIRDPVTKQVEKKNVKHWCVNLASLIVERQMIDFSEYDKDMKGQLENYRVVRQSEYSGPVYNSDQEHAVDALFLSVLALMTNIVKFDDVRNATRVGILKANPFNPEGQTREIATEKTRGYYRGRPIYVPHFSSVRKDYQKKKDEISRKI